MTDTALMNATILIIDDVPDNLRLLSGMLNQHGYKVRVATSGQQALQSAQASPPHLILLDIMMPGMNGYEVCQRLKTDPTTRSIPVLFISALDASGDKVNAFAAGAVDYITKPFRLEEVLARVQTHLALREMQQQLEVKNNELEQEVRERRRVELALAEARDRAIESSAFKSRLLAKVSHELRTPLGTILGYAELLQNGVFAPLTSTQAQATAEIIDSTHYLTNLVNELLDEAQLEAGRVQLRPRTFPVARLVERVEARIKVLAQAKGLAFATEIAPTVPEIINGDEDRLQQMMLNLLGNAVKFTTAGSIRLALDRPDPAGWSFRVSDTGPGIPAEDRSDIFEPFRQLNETTNRPRGSGLGLSIVKQLVVLMNGQITVDSEVGQGSAFTVLLPLAPTQTVRPFNQATTGVLWA